MNINMIKLRLFLGITFLPILFQNTVSAQGYEILKPYIESNDFAKNFGFFKKIDKVPVEKLISNYDTVSYFINDTLDYIYELSRLVEFENRMIENEMKFQARIDSVFNSELNCYDYYFNEDNGSKYLNERKYFEDNLIIKTIEFYDNSVYYTVDFKYDEKNNLIEKTEDCPDESYKVITINKWTKKKLIENSMTVWHNESIREFNIKFNAKNSMTQYSYKSKTTSGEIEEELLYVMDYYSNGKLKEIKGKDNNGSFNYKYKQTKGTITIHKIFKDKLTCLRFEFK